MKKLLLLFLSAAITMCSLSGCFGATSNGSKTDTSSDASNSIVVGIAQDPDNSLDPYRMTAAGTREVMFNVFEGLVKPDSNGQYISAVASDYTVSDDLLTYTFTLREDIKFHDGSDCTAEDILYSFETCAATSVTSSLVTALSLIDEIYADDNVLTVKLSVPCSDFIAYVSSVYIVPSGYAQQDTHPIGTGPFKFVSRSIQQNIVLERFDEYYGEKAYLDKVTYKVYEDGNALFTALNGGALDIVAHLTVDQANNLTNGYEVLEGTMNLVQAIYLNNAAEPFSNELVRKALCYAVDIDGMLALTADGHGTKVGSSMYPAFKKYFDSSLTDAYPHDIDKAKELLAQAGHADGLEFTLTVPSNYSPHIDCATVIATQLKEAGINVTIDLVDWNTWLSSVYQGKDFQATLVGFDSSMLTASGMLSRWTTGNAKNMIGYSNEEYDKAYYAAEASADDEEQTAYYRRCLEILSETAANVYLQDLADFVAVNPKLEGYEFYPLYIMDMSKIRYK